MSRLASSRGSSSGASRGGGGGGKRPGVYVQAAKSDIYVALLGISLAALVIATLLMVLLLNQYGFSIKP